MVLFLFLLESEVFLILFGVELFLLLLVFLVQPGTPRVRNRQPLVRRTIVGMNTRASSIRAPIGGRLIAASTGFLAAFASITLPGSVRHGADASESFHCGDWSLVMPRSARVEGPPVERNDRWSDR